MSRYVRITLPVANARYRFSNLNWVIVFDRCNNVPGHAIVGKAADSAERKRRFPSWASYEGSYSGYAMKPKIH